MCIRDSASITQVLQLFLLMHIDSLLFSLIILQYKAYFPDSSLPSLASKWTYDNEFSEKNHNLRSFYDLKWKVNLCCLPQRSVSVIMKKKGVILYVKWKHETAAKSQRSIPARAGRPDLRDPPDHIQMGKGGVHLDKDTTPIPRWLLLNQYSRRAG